MPKSASGPGNRITTKSHRLANRAEFPATPWSPLGLRCARPRQAAQALPPDPLQ
jgi:hypothetical protein